MSTVKKRGRPKKIIIQEVEPLTINESVTDDNFIPDSIYFTKVKKSNTKDTIHYLALHKDKKIKFTIKKAKIPFGYEAFNNHTILNIEINPKKNNDHYNIYTTLSNVEKIIKELPFNKYSSEVLKADLEGKGYYPNMRESTNGYIIRTYVMSPPNIYAKVGNYEMAMTSSDIKNTISTVIIELGIVWITDHNYGILWALKDIEINNSL